jgi:putative spermidine/putrescine transport system substrate-binding protein
MNSNSRYPKRVKALCAACCAALSLAPLAHAQAPQELVLGIFGGSFADNTKLCHIAPFEKATGAKVKLVLGSSTQNMAKLRATKGSPDIDVAYMDLSIATQAREEGLLAKLDASKMPHYRDLYPSAYDKDDRFVGFMYGASAIAYNPKLIKTPPTSWKDLWNPAYKGKVAVGDISGTTGQHFLIAAARLNGGSVENVEPGFKALAELKPNVNVFYTQADQIVQLFERGDIAIAVWYPDRVGTAAAKGISVATAYPKEGAIGILPTVAIPEGSKHFDLALKFIDVMLSPEAQACFAQKQFAGPVNKKVKLEGELSANVPYGAGVEKLYFPDPLVVAKLLPGWTERWSREIAR